MVLSIFAYICCDSFCVGISACDRNFFVAQANQLTLSILSRIFLFVTLYFSSHFITPRSKAVAVSVVKRERKNLSLFWDVPKCSLYPPE